MSCLTKAVLAGLMAIVLTGAGWAEERTPRVVPVLVLNFDPRVPAVDGKRLHEVCKWNDPRVLAQGYSDDVWQASGKSLQYKIVRWTDLDDFPVKVDGFRYTVESYLACYRAGKGWHNPDGLDYPKVLQQYGVHSRIDRGEAEEVWIFGAPYFGYWEAAMAGPGAFFVNGGVYERVPTKRAFVVMGFNYERGVDCMIHNLGHRTEATMSKVYGGWKCEELTTNWARFAANLKQSGTAAAGTCHYPPNAESDYDYANPREVQSTADDWLNYPKLTGKSRLVSKETWGGPDYQRNYLKWWFAHLPRAEGTNADGKLNNWWRYVFDFNETAIEGGAPQAR